MTGTPASTPLKIIHIIARLNIGGTTPPVVQLIAAQRAAGHDSQLVCGVVGAGEGDMSYMAREYNIPMTLIPSLGREISPIRDLVTLRQVYKLIAKQRPDVVHTHTAKAGFIGRLAAKLAGVRCIVHTFHGHVFRGYFGRAKSLFYLGIEKFSALLSDRLITPSQALKDELAGRYHVAAADKIVPVEYGFRLQTLATIPRQPRTLTAPPDPFRVNMGIPAHAPLIGIVGRLVPIKNHDMFLQAAHIVHTRHPNAWFVLVGDGERRAELEAKVTALGLADRTRFAGWITDVVPVYRALDAVALSSINEGLPVSLIEALAAGVPVVATRVGGVIDLLAGKHIGTLVELDDVVGMAEGLLAAITEPSIAQQAQANRLYILERYSIESCAVRTEQVYHSVLLEKSES